MCNNLCITINIYIIYIVALYVTMFLKIYIYWNQYKFFQLLRVSLFSYKKYSHEICRKCINTVELHLHSPFVLQIIEETAKRSIPRSSPVLGLIPLWNVEEPDCRERAWSSPGCYLRGVNHIAGKKRSFL